MPSRSMRVGQRLVRGAAGARARPASAMPADGLSRTSRRRRPGGRRRAGARSGRRASSRGRRRARRPSAPRIVARSSACRSTVMRARGRAASGAAVARAGRPRSTRNRARKRGAGARPSRLPRPVKPWSSSSGRPAPRDADLPAERRRRRCALMPARQSAEGRAATAAATARWSSTFRARSVRSSRTRTPGPADGVARSPRRGRAVRHEPVLAAERRHDRPDVDPVRRPEQLLVVLRQARCRARRPRAAPGAGTRRCRRRRC